MNTIIILLVALISSSIGILYAYWSLKVGEVDRTIAISNEPKFEINNDFYEENSHYWWGGDKPFESLQRLNDARFPEFERIIKETLIQKQPPSEKKRLLRILDVGFDSVLDYIFFFIILPPPDLIVSIYIVVEEGICQRAYQG